MLSSSFKAPPNSFLDFGYSHSPTPSPETDERNREYLIRRAALGDNPTKEQMDAVVAYGLEQHRINFPHLY